MSITRLQQARQMYATGQRVGRVAFGGGGSQDHHGGQYQGAGAGASGPAGGASSGGNYGGNAGGNPGGKSGGGSPKSYDGPNIHGGPAYTPPTTNIVDEVALTGYGKVPGVDYRAVGPGSQYQKNITLQNQLLNTPYQPLKTPFMTLNTVGNILGGWGHKKNTQFFSDNSIGGKINPATGKPFGYGIDGYKDYMRQRSLGSVGAYGDTLPSYGVDSNDNYQGIETLYSSNMFDDTDTDIDTDTETEGFTWRFAGNQPEDVRKRIEEQYKDYYTI